MQRVQEEESHVGYIPPPPYTLVDQQYPGNNNNNNNNSNNNNPTLQQYHSQNPYPATVIPPDADFRLAQKLQDEEYARWAETNPQQEYYSTRAGETSASTHLPRAPMPPIPEHYQYNHYQSYQNDPTFQHPSQSQQYPIIYASPNQPPLPYTTSPYVNNGGNGGIGYGSLNQGYYTSSQSHPFYNAPYHNYQQITQREEEDSSSCLSGLFSNNEKMIMGMHNEQVVRFSEKYKILIILGSFSDYEEFDVFNCRLSIVLRVEDFGKVSIVM